jgi:hypothetical protein
MNPYTLLSRLSLAALFMLGPSLAHQVKAKDLAPFDAEHFFDPTRVVRVELTVAPADWEMMSGQHRSLIKTLRTDLAPEERESPFDYVRAELTLDGVKLGPVAVRKKGFVGSLDTNRPSLKIQLDRYDKDKSFAGIDTLTLNNNRQDPSRLHQVIGYAAFRAAGLPAARCNLATVSVNGRPLGVYANVESLDKRFFKHRFPGDKGTLWEGTICDFTDDELKRFERKFGPRGAGAKLEAVLAALRLPDEQVIAALEQVLDVDAFLRFWAVENLLGHWDGYASNRNNYFIYHHAGTGRLLFLPWGLDQLASDNNPLWGDPGFVPPKSVKAASELTLRLYNLPAGRERYFATVRALLQDGWSGGKLADQTSQLAALIRSERVESNNHADESVAHLATFLRERAGVLEKELARPAPEWTLRRRDPIKDIYSIGDVELDFTVTTPEFGRRNQKVPQGTGNIRLMFGGREIAFTAPQFNLARTNTPWGETQWTVVISRPEEDALRPAAIEISFSMWGQSPGADSEPLRVDVFASPAQARLLELVGDGKTPAVLASVGGHLKIIALETTPGGTIKGRLSGELFTSREDLRPKK